MCVMSMTLTVVEIPEEVRQEEGPVYLTLLLSNNLAPVHFRNTPYHQHHKWQHCRHNY